MSRNVVISTVQLPALLAGKNTVEKSRVNEDCISAMLDEAGGRGSDLVLFGEYANLPHRGASPKQKEYIPVDPDGRLWSAVRNSARRFRMAVLLPVFAEFRHVAGSYGVLFGRDGEIAGTYLKAHAIVQEQRLGMRPGKKLQVFPLDFGTVGIMICMDIEYPEVAQALMLMGAEVLLFPHVQTGWGEVDWEIRYRARAVDTGLYLVSSCYGYDDAWKPGMMIGRSGVVDRDGIIVADMGRSVGLVTRAIDLDRRRVTHFFFEKSYDRTLAVIASRRPNLYTILTAQDAKRRALRKIRGGELE